ncbi:MULTISPECIES: GntR family transcriptional regulator [Bradyrhizobium]|uniref:GntR family transcriptional regulator n=3 Tax=Bradyrhizobium TaxID=374 RepID=A0A410VHP6_9BRAD|nr:MULTISPECIES: GntR family transcriptional regulator [Bradyrhizobium]MCG2632951.1 GntR family transcriptional regulator [Bradyrhizobium zhengyangense]MCG2645681.1 GntR family transcriptional regulator [Bradyrhizobium zhengyangense]MCG2673153.1 GntR family transcriptional regulator [Bradyrhizobium zhengyangense]MDN4988242.1 GntR family transcriptional regulator [Bradyrhizobium sp. WYCCWR 13022]MDN5006304.1 GntR family transcriptional regulator [Bradyrhizobium sp. WYCCWR 12677]
MLKFNRTSEIANWIKTEIDSGALQPGSKLDEKQLSDRFNVSKTPVREALIQLASRGLVDLKQRRGATVSVLSAEQIVAMFEVMTELEGMSARLAAARMPTDLQARLRDIHSRSESALHNAQLYDAINKELHETIYEGAQNSYLEQSIKETRARLRLYRRYPFQKPGRIQQSYQDHCSIVAAITRGDAMAAAQAMHDHLTTGGRVFADLVAEAARFANTPDKAAG